MHCRENFCAPRRSYTCDRKKTKASVAIYVCSLEFIGDDFQNAFSVGQVKSFLEDVKIS